MACKQIAAVLVLSALVEGASVTQNSGDLQTNKNTRTPSTWLVYHGSLEDVNRQMLKAYIYTDQEFIRASRFSQDQVERARVKIRPRFEQVDNPGNADVFWLDADLGHWEAYHGGVKSIRENISLLPYWKGNEQRHVFYFCSDGAEPVNISAIMFRQSFYKDRKDTNAIAWPYAVEDFGDLFTDDFSSLKYDVSFVGSKVSSISRVESFDSVMNTLDLEWFLSDSRAHWGSIEHTELGKQRKQLFIQSMRDSAMVLAARGGGLSCYRFFEAMSAGRVPVLLADDWELPHADLIDWETCIYQIPECRAKATGSILLEFLRRISNEELAAMGKAARLAWWQYLAPARWPEMMEKCIKARL